MQDFLLQHYLWVKSFHIIAVFAWMAGMLYLPRLFVYHAEAGNKDAILTQTLQTMERRLLRIIMNPALIASWVFGLLMLWANPALLEQGWMHVKLLAIVFMTGMHGIFARWRKNFQRNENIRDAKFYRLWNEAPTALLIIIVFMAVAEPF